MKVYVDFDRTLFDCDQFLDDLYRIINRYNISKELFKKYQNQCNKNGFNPYLILELVKEEYNFSNDLYKEISELMHKAKEYLYSDTLTFLEFLKNKKYEVIILTKGNSDYQREKVFNAKIDSFYNSLIVTMKHKGSLGLDYRNSIFIDDNPVEIINIIKQKPKLIIRVQRDNSKYSNSTLSEEILTVKSLQEIINKKMI